MRTDLALSERRLTTVSAAVFAAMIAAVSLGKPGQSSLLPPCPLHAFTGLFCPGCGTTRALYLLVHGHPVQAMSENALSMLLLPFVLYELGAALTLRWPRLSSRLQPWVLWSLLAVVILFGILRNLPYAPFTMLAPLDLP